MVGSKQMRDEGTGRIQSFSASWEGLRLCLLPLREESITVANSSKSTSLLHPPQTRRCSSASSMPETTVTVHSEDHRMTDCKGTPYGACGIIERGSNLPSASMRLKRRSNSSSLLVCQGLSCSVASDGYQPSSTDMQKPLALLLDAAWGTH